MASLVPPCQRFVDRQPVALPTERSEGGSQSCVPLPVAEEGIALCAAVDKIEEKRKPEDFVGYRNRTPGTTKPTRIDTIRVIQGRLFLYR